MAGGERLTLAHISDLHLPTIGGFGPRHWTVKRTLGYLNWQRGRKLSFTRSAVDALIADMAGQRVDHLAVTGDLINLGLPAELEAATAFLKGLGSPEAVSVVPGNHDIYVRLKRDPGVARWREYMASDAFGQAVLVGIGARADGFPFVRRHGRVALIGLNSALPMPPFVAAGLLGGQQLGALERVLAKLKAQGLARVILIHHPPMVSLAPPRRGLLDARGFEEVIARCGAELVLHGHNHTNTLVWADGAQGRVPVVGIAAAGMSRMAKGRHALARYNLLRFIEDAGMLSIELVGRGLSAEGGDVAELERRVLTTSFALSGDTAGA
ncbi:MAG: hypothetical protein APF80_13315 [Alphaproteobacteria bacterium BRH_c36]|nr:MAG: hypothetical protein APF80_13315 [Alphaproteobacteria bacterium BRH_c36]